MSEPSEAANESAEQLRSYVELVESKHAERDELASEIADVYAEAKSNGFDVKAIKAVIRLRKMNQAEREEQEAILDTYFRALGMPASAAGGDPRGASEFIKPSDIFQ